MNPDSVISLFPPVSFEMTKRVTEQGYWTSLRNDDPWDDGADGDGFRLEVGPIVARVMPKRDRRKRWDILVLHDGGVVLSMSVDRDPISPKVDIVLSMVATFVTLYAKDKLS
jgi:hypothetical protein